MWNYLDVPHLNIVHSAVDATTLLETETVAISIIRQRISLFTFEALLCVWRVDQNKVRYVSSLGWFNFDVTSVASEAEGETTVTTTYVVRSSKLFAPLHRLIRRLLERNYRLLMSEDLPMREQRARLRRRGVHFLGDVDGYGFKESRKIGRDRVVPSASGTEQFDDLFSFDREGNWKRIVPKSGFDLYVSYLAGSDQMLVSPGICSHEGGPLPAPTNGNPSDMCVVCPWHGRRFSAVEVPTVGSVALGCHTLSRDGSSLYISWSGSADSNRFE